MIRALLFTVLVLLTATGPVWLWLVVMAGYAVLYTGLEVVVLVAFAEAFFMSTTSNIPVYTLGVVGFLIMVELGKPFMVFYNQND